MLLEHECCREPHARTSAVRSGGMAAAPRSARLERSLCPEPGGRGVNPRMELLETALLPRLSSGVSPPPYSVTVPNACTEAGKGDFVSVSPSGLVIHCPSGRDHHGWL